METNDEIDSKHSDSSNTDNEEEEEEELVEPVLLNESIDVKIESNIPLIERLLPRHNCIEKIIIIFDISVEKDTTSFQFSEGTQFTPFILAKRALRIFILNKLAIDSKHEFAFIVLHDDPIWATDFSNDPRIILSHLEHMEEMPSSTECDLTKLFNLLAEQLELPDCENKISINTPPSYIYRTFFMYGRSHCLPKFLGGKDSFEQLINNPHFYLDIIYAHESPSDDNNCEGIFDQLCDLDGNGWSYIYEVARNATKYHNTFGKLLSHPLQRPPQKDCHYVFGDD